MGAKNDQPVWERTKSLPQVYRHRNRRYYVRTFSGGKEKWTSLKTTLLSAAKARCREHLEAADALRISGVQPASAALSFDEALVTLRHQLATSGLRPNTKAFHEAGIKLVKRSWKGKGLENLRRITARDVVVWLRSFMANAKPYVPSRAKRAAHNSTGASLTTVKCALGSLRMVLDVAVESGHLPINPARHELVGRELKKIAKQTVREKSIKGGGPTVPSKEDLRKVVDTVRNAGVSDCRAAADFIEFIAYCGARKNEAINVLWSDIVHESNNKSWVHLRVTKNGEARRVPISKNMRDLLERMTKARRSHNSSDSVLRVKEVQGFINSACKKLGISRFTTHTLRHFFTTSCVEENVDVVTLAKWLGHKDKGALLLKVYSHVRPDHEFDMINKVRFA